MRRLGSVVKQFSDKQFSDIDHLVRLLFKSRLIMGLALGLALVLVVITEGTYHQSRTLLMELEQRAMARSQIHMAIQKIWEAQSGLRSYFVTERLDYVLHYEEAVAETRFAMAWLGAYYRGDTELAATLDRFTAHVDEKLAELERAKNLYKEIRSGQRREWASADLDLTGMEPITALGEQLRVAESSRVIVERMRLMKALQFNRIGLLVLFAVALLSFWLLFRKTRDLVALQQLRAGDAQRERDEFQSRLQLRTADLTELARHLQTVREDERSHLARELHDELGALLTAAKLDVARLKRLMGLTLTGDLEDRLSHLNETINQGITLKRRIIEDLRPSSLSNLGLEAALNIFAREFSQRSTIEVKIDIEPVALSDSAQITVFRLVQEAFTNIAKYAGATEVQVVMREEKGRVWICVSDNGCGFDPHATRISSHGLLGMRYRVEAEHGEMKLTTAPNQGTTIKVWLPVDEKSGVQTENADGVKAEADKNTIVHAWLPLSDEEKLTHHNENDWKMID